MIKRLATLFITASIFFGVAQVVMADTLPNYDSFVEDMRYDNQCPPGYYLYNLCNADGSLIGSYQMTIKNGQCLNILHVKDADGNIIHPLITPAEYAAGEYPGGSHWTETSSSSTTTPKTSSTSTQTTTASTNKSTSTTPKQTTSSTKSTQKTMPQTQSSTKPSTTQTASEATKPATTEVAQQPNTQKDTTTSATPDQNNIKNTGTQQIQTQPTATKQNSSCVWYYVGLGFVIVAAIAGFAVYKIKSRS